jgi:hypothetical protein
MTSKPAASSHTPDNPEILHEKSDIGVRGILVFGAALVVGAIVIHVLVWLLFLYFGSVNAGQFPREYPMAPTGVLRLPPAPRLQEKPREELKALRQEEKTLLNQYGWADENAGTARIPVDEAMRRVLAQGLPAAPAPPEGAPSVQPTESNAGRTLQKGYER